LHSVKKSKDKVRPCERDDGVNNRFISAFVFPEGRDRVSAPYQSGTMVACSVGNTEIPVATNASGILFYGIFPANPAAPGTAANGIFVLNFNGWDPSNGSYTSG